MQDFAETSDSCGMRRQHAEEDGLENMMDWRLGMVMTQDGGSLSMMT